MNLTPFFYHAAGTRKLRRRGLHSDRADGHRTELVGDLRSFREMDWSNDPRVLPGARICSQRPHGEGVSNFFVKNFTLKSTARKIKKYSAQRGSSIMTLSLVYRLRLFGGKIRIYTALNFLLDTYAVGTFNV